MTRAALFLAVVCLFALGEARQAPALVPLERAPERVECVVQGEARRVSFEDLVAREAARQDVPTWIAFAVLREESGGRARPRDNVNANGTIDRGRWQLNATAHPEVDPYDDEAATRYALAYLRALYDLAGTWRGAAMAYNGGIGRYLAGRSPRSSRAYAARVMADAPREFSEPGTPRLDIIEARN